MASAGEGSQNQETKVYLILGGDGINRLMKDSPKIHT